MKLKTIDQIKKDSLIKTKHAFKLDELHDKKEIAELRERIKFNDNCILYLRTSPSVDYVKNTKNRLKERIAVIDNDRFHPDKKKLPTLKYQLRIHSYILD